MNFYKKIPLKFSHERVSREFRHSESVKSRDSSRFKRLSMMRNISDSIYEEHSIENPASPAQFLKPAEAQAPSKVSGKVPEAVSNIPSSVPKNTGKSLKPSVKEKQMPTRKEKFLTWKQDRMLRQELEMKNKAKPFYVGKSQPSTNISCIAKGSPSFMNTTMRFNASRMAKSRIAAPNTMIPPPQSRIPYNYKEAYTGTKTANPVIKVNPPCLKKSHTAENPSAAAGNKIGGLPKNTNYTSRLAPVKSIHPPGIKAKVNCNSTSKSITQSGLVPRTAKTISKPPMIKITANSSSKTSSQNGLAPRAVSNASKSDSKSASKSDSNSASKSSSNSASKSNSNSASKSNSNSASKSVSSGTSRLGKITPTLGIKPRINANAAAKPSNQVSSLPKFGLRMPSKAPQVQPPRKVGGAISNCAFNGSAVPKTTIPSRGNVPGRPTSQMPAPNKCGNSFKVPSRPLVKGSSKSTDNVTIRKSIKKQTIAWTEEEIEDSTETMPHKEDPKEQEEIKPFQEVSLSDQSLENATDTIFKCDVSVIQPSSTSFAPDGFQFQTKIIPSCFEDGLFEALECAKRKYNRTSTPSKCESGRASSFSPQKLGDSIQKESTIENNEPESISDELCEGIIQVQSPCKSSNGDFIFKETATVPIKDIFCELDNKPSCNEEANNELLLSKLGDSMQKESTMENNKPERICDQLCKVIIQVQSPRKSSNGDFIFKETADVLINDDIFYEMDRKSPDNVNRTDELCQKSPEKEQIAVCDILVNAVADENILDVLQNGNGSKLEIIKETDYENISVELEKDKSTCKVEKSNEILRIENGEEISSAQLNVKEERETVVVGLMKGNVKNSTESIINEMAKMSSDDQPLFEVLSEDQLINELTSASPHKIVTQENKPDELLLLSFSPPKELACDELRQVIEGNMQQLKEAEEEEQDTDNVAEIEAIKSTERSTTGAIPKRVSMLKHISVLNSIHETHEADSSIILSPSEKCQNTVSTPRRSMRLSRPIIECDIKSPIKKVPSSSNNDFSLWNCTDDSPVNPSWKSRMTLRNSKRLSNSVLKQVNSDAQRKLTVEEVAEGKLINITPRRSMRLKKAVSQDEESNMLDISSPFGKENLRTPRRSVRLINLNTPESDTCGGPIRQSNLTADFEQLRITSEGNLDSAIFDSPVPVASKKVSLLYSPRKRMSIRSSIKGDLMAFSPSGE